MEEINHNSWSYNLLYDMHVLYGILLGAEAWVDQKLLFIEIRFDTNYDSNWECVPSHIALKRCILNLDSSLLI